MNVLSRLVASLTLCMALSAPCLLAEQPAIAKGQMQNVSGLPQVVEEKISGKSFQVSRMLVKARPAEVWRILTDYKNAPNVFVNLKQCKLLEDRGDTKIMHHVIHPTGVFGTFQYTLEVKETGPRQLEWHRVSGDFKEVDGHWKVESAEGGRAALVTYASYVNGGMFLPQSLIKRQVRIDMPQVMHALKTQSEAPQIARQPQFPANNN